MAVVERAFTNHSRIRLVVNTIRLVKDLTNQSGNNKIQGKKQNKFTHTRRTLRIYEVRHQLISMGKNGWFSSAFLQTLLGDSRGSNCVSYSKFFRDGRLLKEFNQTFITLIPKKKGACNFNQFQPISLSNVCYKVISKIIVNRLRPLLPKMVDPAQVAFVG